jgi:hypothetical protein
MDEWLVVVASPKLFKKFGSLDDRESFEGIPDAPGARRTLGKLRERALHPRPGPRDRRSSTTR